MEVILLEKVQNLGNLGDKVTVKPGFGRNYLVPQGKAVPATRENLAEFEKRREELEKRAQDQLATAEARKTELEGATVTITAKASGEGKLYGSVGPREIAEALTRDGKPVEKSELVMGEGIFREAGEYEVNVQLHADVEITITVVVVGEE